MQLRIYLGTSTQKNVITLQPCSTPIVQDLPLAPPLPEFPLVAPSVFSLSQSDKGGCQAVFINVWVQYEVLLFCEYQA